MNIFWDFFLRHGLAGLRLVVVAGSQPAVASKKPPWMYETIWSFSTLGVQRERQIQQRSWSQPNRWSCLGRKKRTIFQDWLEVFKWKCLSWLGGEKGFFLWEENIFNDFSGKLNSKFLLKRSQLNAQSQLCMVIATCRGDVSSPPFQIAKPQRGQAEIAILEGSNIVEIQNQDLKSLSYIKNSRFPRL